MAYRVTRSLLAVLLGGLFVVAPAVAHDSHGNPNWISQGNFVSPVDGSHCCGVGDCAEVDPDDVTEVRGGYRVRGWVTYGTGAGAVREWVDEVVPAREVQASRDGRYWRCSYRFHEDKTKRNRRRCFFAPPQGS